MRIIHTLPVGVALAGVLTLAPATAAIAATGASTGGTTGTGGENTPLHLSAPQVHHVAAGGGSSIMRTLLALVIVIGLIYAIARILKAVKGRGQRASGDGLSHIATLPLGTNKSLALVRSGADIVLVGISESGVTPIKTYTEEEAIATGILEPASAPDGARRAEPSFQSFLDGVRQMTVRS